MKDKKNTVTSRKKQNKNDKQISALKRYLGYRPDNWPKEEIIELAKKIHLSRNQVYKWLWDQRNILREMIKQQEERPYESGYMNLLGEGDDKGPLKMQNKIYQKYRAINLRSQSQDFVLRVPENIEFAVKIRIPQSTGSNFKTLLRAYGCELTRLRKEATYDTPEKKPRFAAEINEFLPVSEEKQPSRR
jgi:hypothetical protein